MYYYEDVNNECVAIFTFYEAELMRRFFIMILLQKNV